MKFFSILVVIISCDIALTSKSHPITTLINAKWDSTPVALEIAEYLSDENSNFYWDFIDKLDNLDKPLNEIEPDSKQYKTAINVAGNLLSAPQIPLLKLSLAMHSLSPRVQAHLQIASEVLKHGDCDTDAFISIEEEIICDLDDINSALKRVKASKVQSYAFDHVYPGSENNTITAILYSQIGSKDSKKFHAVLKQKAEKENVKYVSRHYIRNHLAKRVRLSGYGVELHLKSTEYKSQDDSPRSAGENEQTDDDHLETEVEGFDFKTLKDRFPAMVHSLDRLRNTLLEKNEEIVPLKPWEFQELGLQAAELVASIQGEEALQILQFTAQNFPSQAKSLVHTTVSDSFKKEMKHNIEILGRSLNLQPPDAALFINGLFFDAETIDVGSLLETLKEEIRVLDGLHKIGLHGSTTAPLLALDLSSTSSKDFAIDIRDSAIVWINDLENDQDYKRWPSSVMDLLRPRFPGMLANIRKNLFNMVLIVDPLAPESRGILKLSESFIAHLAPIRLGIVLDSRKSTKETENEYRSILCAFNYLTQKKNAKDALGFLTDIFSIVKPETTVKFDDIRKQLKKTFPKLSNEQIDDIVDEDSDFDYGRQLSLEFLDRLGLHTTPQVLLNGAPLSESSLTVDEFEETVLTEIMQQTPIIQKAVYRGDLSDNEVVIDYLMGQPHVMPRLNQRILSTDDTSFIDNSGKANNDIENINSLIQLSNRDMTATLMSNLKYFGSKQSMEKLLGNSVHFLTVWIVTDLNTDSGRSLLENALKYMKSNGGVRVAFIPNADGLNTEEKTKNLNRLVWSASHTLEAVEATNLVLKWLKQDRNEIYEIPRPVKDLLSSTDLHLKLLRAYSQRVLKLKSSESAVLSNGKIIGPLNENEIFSIEDFGLMDRFSNLQYGDKIKKALAEISIEIEDIKINSDTILKLISILVPRQQSKNRFTLPTDLQDDHTVVKLPPKSSNLPYFDIVGVLDPASRGAQKLTPILIMLRNVVNSNMKVFMCAVDKHSDMPVKNFYRFVIETDLQFSPDGKLESGPMAKFTGLPVGSLLTQNLQVPENWLVEVVRSVYDLDNIKLEDINGPVHSEFDLENLLLEGHCFDTTTGAPPRGLQITLGTNEQPILVDTIVMANLGYFQLKANPGAWILKLRQGKSADIYDIASAEGPNTIHSVEEGTRVIISSLRSTVLKLRVTKKTGQSQADLLGDDLETQHGIWDSITSSFGVGGGDGQQTETINIFSVASGHLYERLLRIMMMSLLKHTESPVKFWFLKNYLSPQFIDFLPHMAKEYKFQYELVQYKWPRWLHQQTEKQRMIWGYKILFLDVLFPLDIKKIIFVDADAIVRADIKELFEMDLGGAPYAYTPFCDSRKEMEGFRFWKQGYWRNHLQGRKYHISALYVVDLKKFRKIAAGDRLRGQYQALSQDPNSLSNLDQDLPNNMIHQVAIKSLPQEWLWCSTWCNDDGLQTAKTIDLCNNPLTKEAKLTAAQRLVPEWKDYDQEIKNLFNRVEAGEVEHEEFDEEILKEIHNEL